MSGLKINQYMQTALGEHPYNFFEPEKEMGRKIYWYGLPAIIKPRKTDEWEISIIPDYTCGLSKEEWWKELSRRESLFGKQNDDDDLSEEEEAADYMRDDCINWGDAFSDQHINWFRKS